MSQQPAKATAIGARLREARKAREPRVSMRWIADQLGWSEAKVSRMETGNRPVDADEVAAYLRVLGVAGTERERLVSMAKTPDEPAWLEELSGVPQSSVTLATWEAQAVAVWDWAPLLIPGLLQTMEYGREYMLGDNIPEGEIGVRLSARQRRQTMLPGLQYTAIIDQPVLHRRVGSRRTHRAQLQQLLDVANDLPNVDIRVLPVASDRHPARVSPWLMLEFSASPRMVHVELSRSAVFFTEPTQTDHYLFERAELLARVMDREHSQRAIKDALGD
ncbi:helix-turn-helix domain-containing protein [Saccharothrix lopnurensis]|uniref:Helix-turn-helix domain-containing protein n=1 Tax=Saccharothrix lopnurensis TaxID=1670621 RepID=A0ABW1PIU6_9PSEU